MPNTKSALKAMRVSERRRARNKPIRTGVKTRIRKAEKEIEDGALDSAQTLVVQATSALDKAAQKGIIHRNNAARRKSRLMRKLNKALAQTHEAAAEAPKVAARRGAKAGARTTTAKSRTTASRTRTSAGKSKPSKG